MPLASIIIPVFNQWNFTKKCLLCLAANSPGEKIEIIVVDNASSDETGRDCPILGEKLFGQSFIYLRNEENRNFAGATNQGSLIANGDFLVFLNNDTEPQKDWLEPLLSDFSTWTDLGASSPLLVYPPQNPLGCTVQHLGVFVSPFNTVGHLYEGIPAMSSLAKKRRFLNIITAACMVMPKKLFLEMGMFDENYKNGFEDIDLCLKLTTKARRITVNPNSVVIHYTSQTPGRFDNDHANGQYFAEHAVAPLKADWQILLEADGNCLSLSPWLNLYAGMDQKKLTKLNPLAEKMSYEELRDMLFIHPLWQAAWHGLIKKCTDIYEQASLINCFWKICSLPQYTLLAMTIADRLKNEKLRSEWQRVAEDFTKSPFSYLKQARNDEKYCKHLGYESLSAQYGIWIQNYQKFHDITYHNFKTEFSAFTQK